jgi:hypothetical protein
VAASPTLSSTVTSWTFTPTGGGTTGTLVSGAFSPPARTLISVAVVLSDYGAATPNPTYTITNSGTALSWTRVAHDRRTSGAGIDNNTGVHVAVFEAWNVGAQTNITITFNLDTAGSAFVQTGIARAFIWTDANAVGATHAASSGTFVTTNDLTVSAAAVANSRIVVAAVEGRDATGQPAPTSSDLTATFGSWDAVASYVLGHKLADSNPETYNLDAFGTANAEWLYSSAQVYPEQAAPIGGTAATNGGLSVVNVSQVGSATVDFDNTQVVDGAGGIASAAALGAPDVGFTQTVSIAGIASTARFGATGVGAPISEFRCEGTPGAFLEYLPGSSPGGTTRSSLYTEWEPEPAGGWMGGPMWEMLGTDVFEYRSEVAHRGTTSMRPGVVFESGVSPETWTFGGVWVVGANPVIGAAPPTPQFHQRAYFYLTEYPVADMAFLWYEESYPWAGGPLEPMNWVGMCPWGRFELWTNGGFVRTDPNVIPLDQWFRVETLVNTNGIRHRLTTRIYFDAEAPVEGYDIELTSNWVDDPAGFAGVPYSPFQGGLGDVIGQPYGPTDDDMGLYFDDVALGPAALGWIGPSGGALSHYGTESTEQVGQPTISQTIPLTDVGGVPSTATVGDVTLTLTFNQSLTLAGLPSTSFVAGGRILEGLPLATRIFPSAPSVFTSG